MRSFLFIALGIQVLFIESVLCQIGSYHQNQLSGGQFGPNPGQISQIAGQYNSLGVPVGPYGQYGPVLGNVGAGFGPSNSLAGPNGVGPYGYDSYPGSNGMYGGSGGGDVAVTGELPVGGSTNVFGNVPVIGKVQFGGPVAAAGAVTISGTCACNVPYGY